MNFGVIFVGYSHTQEVELWPLEMKTDENNQHIFIKKLFYLGELNWSFIRTYKARKQIPQQNE